jgi:archaeal type IV pilus assembly protein PilA
MKSSTENAVSPVIGVMLMLVVTIIIAAIVSAYAGGAAQSSKQAPQASIKGVCYVNGSSNSNFVILTHMGGDNLAPAKIQVVIKQGDEWGSYTGILSGYTQVIDPTTITDSTGKKFWINATSGGTEVAVWRPSESMSIKYSGVSSSDVGKTLDLEINTVDGKTIAKSKIPVVP